MSSKKTVVIGASENPERYSNMAIKKLLLHQHEVVAIGNKNGMVQSVPIVKERPVIDDVDTVTFYLNPKNQESFYDYILSLQPKRLIFNPGTENEILEKLAAEHQIETKQACTLVLLATGQY